MFGYGKTADRIYLLLVAMRYMGRGRHMPGCVIGIGVGGWLFRMDAQKQTAKTRQRFPDALLSDMCARTNGRPGSSGQSQHQLQVLHGCAAGALAQVVEPCGAHGMGQAVVAMDADFQQVGVF